MSRWHSCVQLEPDSMHIVNPTNIGYKCQKKKKRHCFPTVNSLERSTRNLTVGLYLFINPHLRLSLSFVNYILQAYELAAFALVSIIMLEYRTFR